MTIVEGQIESLKKVKEALNQNGIVRFNSIGQIESFKKNYDSERYKIPRIIANELDVEIKALKSDLVGYQRTYDDLKAHISNGINRDIKALEDELQQVKSKASKNLILRMFLGFKIRRLSSKKAKLESNFDKIVESKARNAEYKVIRTKNNLDGLVKNKDKIITERCAQAYKDIDYTKKVPLASGNSPACFPQQDIPAGLQEIGSPGIKKDYI
jgi:hypothetical protein